MGGLGKEAQAQRAEVDRQGRLRIPAELARFARLGKELALIGVRTHIEIWNKPDWEEYVTRQQGRFDDIAETAFDRSRSSSKPGSAPVQTGLGTNIEAPRSPR